MSAASVLWASGCLSKPERPRGTGGPGEDGGGAGVDGGYIPNSGFLLRRQSAVGDLDGDSLDDAVVWGNAGADIEEQGQRPVIRVYWGDVTAGLLPTPEEIDMRFDPDRPWYEVLDVAIEKNDSIVFLTAEDLAERDSPPPHVRRVRAGFIPVTGKLIGDRVFRSQDDLTVSGYVDNPAPLYLLSREQAYGTETRLVFAFADYEAMWLPSLAGESQFDPAESSFFYWVEESPVEQQEAFTVNVGLDVEDQIVVTRKNVGRTVGDASAGQTIYEEPFGDDCTRVARGSSEYGTFYGLATCEGSPGASLIVSINTSEPPSIYPVDLAGVSSPTDLDIRDVGGDPLSAEIITIEEGALLVYGDVMIGPPVFFDWDISMPIDDGYDLLAVGHFRGQNTHQIFILSTTDADKPPLCFEVTGTFRLVECS